MKWDNHTLTKAENVKIGNYITDSISSNGNKVLSVTQSDTGTITFHLENVSIAYSPWALIYVVDRN